jgi:hypothetical protein
LKRRASDRARESSRDRRRYDPDVSRIGRGLAALVAGAGLAVVLAGWSVVIHRPVRMVVGNMCEPTGDNPHGYCFRQLPAGGWPFAFLYDSPGTSVVGKLGAEDTFESGWFLLDTAVFGALQAGGALALGLRRRSGTGGGGPQRARPAPTHAGREPRQAA